ncbi:CDP-glycerol glycerophosphotransferase family protein [Salegentibacter maritimus]|uniref:CDP-glycerol glycerophosphotransferase family protein n=1 Tax=Salegentibacter maritimus TaxID=2794347 RepID=A0ABS0TFU5_9FLAO|nr:CDP-glycerol glycerophosphotransferase family protein [Salegentibacter maritimus]MBI6119925.1 CDP-glycerol glycerophosphotransferase family protein [Salegentibacter maritimus]
MNYRFLIYISYTYAFPIGEPLEEEIKKRGYQVKWFADEPETKKKFSKDKLVLDDIHQAIDYNPHIILSITNSIADFLPGLKVQVFHGIAPSKRNFKKGHFRIRGFFDLYSTQGPFTTQPFKELQKKYRHFEVVETGWPKLDPLFPLEEIPREKPSILISSTFSKKLSLAYNDDVIEEIKRISKKGNWNFKVVLHPKIPQERVQKFIDIQGKNLTYYDTTDLIPLFRESDVLFADSTSVVTEFLLQEKPVVTFRNSQPGKHLLNITQVEKIESAIENALDPDVNLLEEIQEFNKNMHPYKDGKSSARLIDASIKFLHADKSHLKPKPLNIIRKLKVRKNLNFYPLKTYRKPPTIK